MKKHVFGFAVFCFIVFTAAVLNNLFGSVAPHAETFVIYNRAQTKPKTFCNLPGNYSDDPQMVNIRQAVLDIDTKKLRASISFYPTSRENFTLALHFFAKDGKHTRYLSTESIGINSTFDAGKESILISSEWLEKLESLDNLYVVPETYGSWKHNPPRFDYSTAVPVVLVRE